MAEYTYIEPGKQVEHKHEELTVKESRLAYRAAEAYAAECKAHGIEAPPDVIRAVLCAALEWLRIRNEAAMLMAGYAEHGSKRH